MPALYFSASLNFLILLFVKPKLAETLNLSRLTQLQLPFQSGTGRILVTQGAVVLAGTITCLFWGLIAAYSALLGGLACLVPNTYTLWRVFGEHHALHPSDPRIFGVMLRAEIVKIAITGFIFAGIFYLFEPINPVAMFAVFTIATFAGWIEAGLRIN